MIENSNPGSLYLCATPIGNLEDITLRALRILREADVVAAEDTRHTRKLLNHYDIHTPLTSYHEHNRKGKGEKLIAMLKEGKNIALVSDAGTPGVSDPGEELVSLAVAEGITVVPVPGPSAVISALVCSGQPTGRFAFEGFLPRTKKERRRVMTRLASEERTIVFYESPHRVIKTLEEILELAGDRNIAVTRELTKVYEEIIRGSVSRVTDYFRAIPPKGEFTIVLEGKRDEKAGLCNGINPDITAMVNNLVKEGRDKKQAMKEVAGALGISKREVYERFLREKEIR